MSLNKPKVGITQGTFDLTRQFVTLPPGSPSPYQAGPGDDLILSNNAGQVIVLPPTSIAPPGAVLQVAAETACTVQAGGGQVIQGPSVLSAGSVTTFVWDATSASWMSTTTGAAGPGGTINVLAFKAKGDGVTDDTSAFNAALLVAQSLGLNVFAPRTAAFYSIAGNINIPGSNTGIIGENALTSGAATGNGTEISFVGTGNGFIIPPNANNLLFKDFYVDCSAAPAAGPIFQNNVTGGGSGCAYSLMDHVQAKTKNPSVPIYQLGSDGAGNGAGMLMMKFHRCDFVTAVAGQSVPLVALYGKGGALNNVHFDHCQLRQNNTQDATAPTVLVKATDNGLITDIIFRDIDFEQPVAGAVWFQSVQQSLLDSCWEGDLTINPTQHVFRFTKSPLSTIVCTAIVIRALQAADGVTGKDTVFFDGSAVGQSGCILHGCKLPFVGNGGPGANPLLAMGCTIQGVDGDPVVHLDSTGNMLANRLTANVAGAKFEAQGLVGALATFAAIYAAGAVGVETGSNYAMASNSTATILNGTAQSELAANGAEVLTALPTSVTCGQPLTGGTSATPASLRLNASTGVSAAVSFSLSAAQQSTPVIQLTGTVPGGGTTITLPNTIGATWIFDLSAVTLTGNLTFTTGAGTTAVVAAADLGTHKRLVTVVVSASNVVSWG